MKTKKGLFVLIAMVVFTLTSTVGAYAFDHAADNWQYGVQSKGIDLLFLDRVHSTYSIFYCPSQKHHGTAVMDSDSVRADALAGYTASAYTSWHDSFSSTRAYYGHD